VTVRVLGTIVVLGVLLLVLPYQDLRTAIGSIPGRAWPVAVGTYLLLHLLGVMKWRMLVNAAGSELSFAAAARAYYWGLFGNTFLPSVVGGDVVKVATALRSARSRSGLVLGSITDRILDTAGLVMVAGFGALLSPRMLDAQSRRIFVGISVLGLVALGAVAGIVMLTPVRKLRFGLRRKIVRLRESVRATARRPLAIGASFLTGVVLQVLLIVLNSWIGRFTGIDVPLYVWLFVWPLAKISAILPLTQGGIGVREAALAILFAPFGVSGAQAVGSGLAFTAVVIAGALTGGFLLFVSGSRLERMAPAPAARGA
jgi:uncharacterized protein (TIRG00374 family)